MAVILTKLRNIISAFVLLFGLIHTFHANAKNDLSTLLAGKNLLLFSKTTKVRHASIKEAIESFEALGKQYQFSVHKTENSAEFTTDKLTNFDAIVFINTTGPLFNPTQRQAFKKYIQSGGGFMGVHASAWCELDWPWFVKLVGGTFISHPKIQSARLNKINTTDYFINRLPASFMFTDEWYNFINLNPERIDILTVDETSYQGKKIHGEHHPIAWFHHYDGGRSFYTSLGHHGDTYFNKMMQTHLLDGLLFVTGALNHAK
ncbi:ThuA domain-containing protein [Gayadomonas joobiniege]|uniref:ThuA domain-containing protein n=1 Tax=Gayadomonas joobiniege TaxID=1234606 RepID=UPI000377B043|nr:ThuA domain-containing protein [Gayadomonas joobiniege]